MHSNVEESLVVHWIYMNFTKFKDVVDFRNDMWRRR